MGTLKISNGGSYGVASTGTCLVKRLLGFYRNMSSKEAAWPPFALTEELFKGF